MKSVLKNNLFAFVTGAALAGFPALALAGSGEQPAAASFYPLVGHWTGSGKLSADGGDPMELTLDLNCSKAAGGWAVRCDMVATNSDITMNESDLMGVDPITGKGHWYAITDQGDAHDHIVEWTDPNNAKASYSWTQDGKQMTENISLKFAEGNSMEFASVVAADGKQVNMFSGTLTK